MPVSEPWIPLSNVFQLFPDISTEKVERRSGSFEWFTVLSTNSTNHSSVYLFENPFFNESFFSTGRKEVGFCCPRAECEGNS